MTSTEEEAMKHHANEFQHYNDLNASESSGLFFEEDQ